MLMLKNLLLSFEVTSNLFVPNDSQTQKAVSFNKDEINYRENFMKDYLKSVDLMSSFSYQEINDLFKLKIFNDENSKMKFFENYKKNDNIYNYFHKEVSKMSKSKSRKKRELLTENERVKLKKLLNDLTASRDEIQRNNTNAAIIGGSGLGIIALGAAFAPFTFGASLSVLGAIGVGMAVSGTDTGIQTSTRLSNINNYIRRLKNLIEDAKTLKDSDDEYNLLMNIYKFIRDYKKNGPDAAWGIPIENGIDIEDFQSTAEKFYDDR
ncbi:hypothetical protein ACW95P_01710 [Candidatus Mycoplasma pogonae]